MAARQRFIWPNLWEDEAISGDLTPDEQLLFIACFSNADDDGRLVGSGAHLRSVAFRYRDYTLEQVAAMRDHIAVVCRNFVVYEVDGREYIALLKWSEYQHPKYPKPSKLPPFPSAKRGGSVRKASAKREPALRARDGMGRDGLGYLPSARPEAEVEASVAQQAKDAAAHLKQRLRERGIEKFPRDAHLVWAGEARRIITELGCDGQAVKAGIDAALSHPWWGSRCVDMFKVHDAMLQFRLEQTQGAPARASPEASGRGDAVDVDELRRRKEAMTREHAVAPG